MPDMIGSPTPVKTAKQLQILDAAREMFLTGGVLTVGMAEIARTAEVSKKTLYKYYADREILTAAVVVHDFEIWTEWFFDAVQERETTTGTAFDAFHEVLRLWMDAPDYQGCLFARVVLADEAMPASIREVAVSCAAVLHKFLVRQARALGVGDQAAHARSQFIRMLLLLGCAARHLDTHFENHLLRDVQSGSRRA